jgi:hypothetical protein
MYGGIAKINELLHGINQGVKTEYEEVDILSDDEVLITPTTTPLSPHNRAYQNP